MATIQPLTEPIMLQDVLAHLKDLMTASGMAVKESNCLKMRSMVTTACERTSQHQFQVFEHMYKNGMYPVDNATAAQIQACITRFK